MLAYLDNNVICSIEENDYSLSRIIRIIDQPNIEFPYSHAHIQEADNITDSNKGNKDFLINRRLDTIKNITKGLYLFHDLKTNKTIIQNENPATVLETIREVPIGKPAMQNFVNLFSFEQKEQLRKSLGIDIKEINNYNPKQVVEHLSKKVSNWGMEFSFLGLIEKGVSLHPNGKSFGLMHRIGAVFELLDLFGYWKDKETETSNYARLWDSTHTYFASFCEYYISDDKRTRNKSKVVFDIFDIKTILISSDGNA
jgi:hypothetical protein